MSNDGNALHLRTALTRSPPALTTGRPCLAGTQTLKHQQAEEKRINLNLTNERFFSLNARECTQESSGNGSVLSDQGNSSYFENGNKYEANLLWAGQGHVKLEGDTSDMSIEKSDEFINGSGNSSNSNNNNLEDPVVKSEYRPLGARAKDFSVAVTASPSSSGRSTLHYASDDDFDYDSMVEQTHKIASEDFQTLDDNLTFIAQYVKELTGCGESIKSISTTDNRVKNAPSTHKFTTANKPQYQQQQQQQQPPSQSIRTSLPHPVHNQDDCQPQKLQQLQQLYQSAVWLLSTRNNTEIGKDLTNSLTQDFLLSFSTNSNINEDLLNSFLTTADSINERGNRRSLTESDQCDTPSPFTTFQSPNQNRQVTENDLTSHEESLHRNILHNTSHVSTQKNFQDMHSVGMHRISSSNENSVGALLNGRISALQNPPSSADYNHLVNPPTQLIANHITTNLFSKTTSNYTPFLVNLLNMSQSLMNTSGGQMNTTVLQEQTDIILNLLVNQRASIQSNSLCNNNSNNNNNAVNNLPQMSHGYSAVGHLTSLASSSLSGYQGNISSFSSSCQNDQHTMLNRSLTEKLSQRIIPYQQRLNSFTNDVDKVANVYRNSAGYCYLIFEEETSVSKLLANCFENPDKGGNYYKMSSPKFVSKDVQVIPWVLSDDRFSNSTPKPEDMKRSVFVGALHALITAEALVKIMDDIFGNVVYATLDTDRYKYPTGSARVVFSSNKSYTKAIIANFVNIRTSKFIKTIQIDPYLENTVCSSCTTFPGIYFCRALECFKYFCPACWYVRHKSFDNSYMHIPLRRGFRTNVDQQ
ncbi:unnamed protein product [Trichobilharzia szidati]|nr:unnamed protein product [Trichobilharzia szidati]